MRIAAFYLLAQGSATSIVSSDPCSELCRADGPSTCTGGSWNNNGICHGYLFRGDPSSNDYCYHTAATARSCPSGGLAVRVSDVGRLLATRQSTTTPAPSSTITSSSFREGPVEHYPSTAQPILDYEEFRLAVPRSTAFESLVPLLVNAPISSFHAANLSVEFIGESGSGEGFLREWFTEVSQRAMRHGSGLVYVSDDDFTFSMIDDNPLARHDNLRAIGRFMALAYLHQMQIAIPFPEMVYAALLGAPLTLRGVESENPSFYSSLEARMRIVRDELPDYPISMDPYTNVPTIWTRHVFDNRSIVRLIGSITSRQFGIVRSSFNEIVPIDGLVLDWCPMLLRERIQGRSYVGFRDLVRNLRSISNDSSDAIPLGWLITILGPLEDSDLRRFLRFATGSTQVPFGGFSSRPISVVFNSQSDQVPRASANTRTVYLPHYTSQAEMRSAIFSALGLRWD